MRFVPPLLAVVVQTAQLLTFTVSMFASVGEFDVQIVPQESDNFYEFNARLWLPPPHEKIAATLVFLNGTDSDARSMVSNREWQQFAECHQVALLGCHFRGDGEPYEQATRGSGHALLAAIRLLSEKSGRPDVGDAPIVLIGHSAGAMFAYNFTCWKPNAVLTFISMKSGPISPSKNFEAAKVPGLFILGEKDLQGRVRSTANAYQEMNKDNRLWALAVEPAGGHGSSESIRELIRVYLQDIFLLLKGGFLPEGNENAYMQGVARILEMPRKHYEIDAQSRYDIAWLPGKASARCWQDLVKPVYLRNFVEMGGVPDSLNQRTPSAFIDLGDIDLRDKAPSPRKSFVLNVELAADHGFISEDKRFNLLSVAKQPPNDTLLSLEINEDRLTPGTLRSSFQVKSKSGERVSFEVQGRVLADYRAKPASLYVGVIPRGRIAEMHVSIIDDSAPQVKIGSIRSSKPVFAEAETTKEGKLLCRFDGTHAFGNQSGHFDVTLEGEPEKRLRIPFIAWVSKQRSP